MTNEERDEKIEATHNAVTTMQAVWEDRCEQMDESTRALKGHNNTPGLITQVFKLEMALYTIAGSAVLTVLVVGAGWAFSKF